MLRQLLAMCPAHVASPELSLRAGHLNGGRVDSGISCGRAVHASRFPHLTSGTPTRGFLFAGRWKGALVAIKVVEHNMEGSAIVVEGARESLLAASVSHPNVVSVPGLKRTTKMDEAPGHVLGSQQCPLRHV